MKTTLIIDTDKIGLYRVLTWMKNMEITLLSVEHEGDKPQEIEKTIDVGAVCERFEQHEQAVVASLEAVKQ